MNNLPILIRGQTFLKNKVFLFAGLVDVEKFPSYGPTAKKCYLFGNNGYVLQMNCLDRNVLLYVVVASLMTFSQLSCQTLLLEFFLSRPSFSSFSRRISHMKWPEWKLFVFLDDIFVKKKKFPYAAQVWWIRWEDTYLSKFEKIL